MRKALSLSLLIISKIECNTIPRTVTVLASRFVIVRFLRRFETGSDDYTQERNQLLGKFMLEDICDQVEQSRSQDNSVFYYQLLIEQVLPLRILLKALGCALLDAFRHSKPLLSARSHREHKKLCRSSSARTPKHLNTLSL